MSSLSTWSSPAKLPTFVDPIEKYLLTNRLEVNRHAMNQDHTIDKQQLLESESLDPLVCVNPYDVNPLSESSDLRYGTLTAEIPLKVESSVSQRSPDGTSCRGFYGPQRKIKLEMEEFGDLSPFVSRKRMFTNSIDELNTPIFDKDAFDFDISNYEDNVQADFVMLKCDASFYRGGAQIATHEPSRQDNSTASNKDLFLNMDTIGRNITILPLENMRHNTDATLYSPAASDNGTYIENISPNTSMVFEYEMNNSVSVNLDSRNSSSYGKIQMETPEGSEHSYNLSPNHQMSYPPSPYSQITHMITSEADESFCRIRPKLSLDISLGHQPAVLDVSTPSLIAEVVNIDATGFNILDLISEDNIPLNSDIFPNSLNNLPIQQAPPKFKESHHKTSGKQHRRRRAKDDDDDEDYVPPSKKSTSYPRKPRSTPKYDSSDSEYEEKPRKKPRGRPPKRSESISSDCSKDSDISRYRELRDKNNEASRKSRLKRKTKDLEIENEAAELHNKNIKLKAQVEELEKMVNNFRDNLFKIMIKK